MGETGGLVCIASGGNGMRRSMNEIHRAHGIGLLILEETPTRPSLRRGRIPSVPLYRRLRRRIGRELRGLRSEWRPPTGGTVELDADIEVLRVPHASDPRVCERLRRREPDVLLADGGSVLPDDLIGSAATALNVHWGLAPWYRGLYCTAWALLGWDPHGIGVTVHHMTATIDGGPVVAHAATPPEPGDDQTDIADRQRDVALSLVLGCLDRHRGGRPLPATPQDLTQGRLYTAEMWSPALSAAVADLLARDGLARMLARPARPPRELVELDVS